MRNAESRNPAGDHPRILVELNTGEPGAVKVACPVRWGVAGKGFAHADTSPAAYPAGPACSQQGCRTRSALVNIGDPWPSLDEAEWRVLAMQRKLHHWAKTDPGRRFDD